MGYALLCVGALGDYDGIERYVDTAYALADRYGDRARHARSMTLLFGAGFVEPWVRPFGTSLEALRHGFERGLREDDELTAYCNPVMMLGMLNFMGQSASELDKLASSGHRENERRKMTNWQVSCKQVEVEVAAWRSHGDPLEFYFGFRHELQERDCLAAAVFRFGGARLCHAFGDLDRACVLLRELEGLEHQLFGSIGVPWIAYLQGLIGAAIYDASTGWARVRWRRKIVRAAASMTSWAERCPDNYACAAAFLNAERSRIVHRNRDAAPAYQAAATLAAEHGYWRNLAEICERHADYVRVSDPRRAHALLSRAREAWNTFGAPAKVRVLDQSLALDAATANDRAVRDSRG